MTEYLDLEDVLSLHRALVSDATVRDYGLLQSAIARPSTTVFGDEAYPTVWEKAAALLESLTRNHAFVDGNKRVGWVATLTFLTINGHRLDPDFDQQQAEDLVLAVATGQHDVASIAAELIKYTTR